MARKMGKTIALGLGLVALSAGFGGAMAAPACGKHEAITEQLTRKFSENRTSMGLASNGSVLEVYASKAGTWTILVTLPSGQTCILAAGEAWEPENPKVLAGQPS